MTQKSLVRILGILLLAGGGAWVSTQDFFLAAVARVSEIVETRDWTNHCTDERLKDFKLRYESTLQVHRTESLLLEGIAFYSRCPKFSASGRMLEFLKEELVLLRRPPAAPPVAVERPAEEPRAAIKYVSPRSIKELPPAAADFFESKNCKVPVTSDLNYGPEAEQVNVKAGEFAAKGQKDWAILCSVGGASSILIFWGGPARCAESVNSDSDSNHSASDPHYAFMRAIDVVDSGFMTSHAQAYDGPNPPKVIDHQGLSDGKPGGASGVVYCHGGEWLSLQGAD